MAEKNIPPPKKPDRPFECGECKKPIKVVYTEIIGNTVTHTSMCADCPELQKRLHGTSYLAHAGVLYEPGAGLACGNCGTTLAALRMGNPLGCNVCYEIFEEPLLNEIQAAKKMPAWINLSKKSQPIHIGRAPGEAQEINPSLRLLALNEALSETLKREDYEQAALLRDQIKALTEKQKEQSEGKKNEG
jgi:protein arginine kinase activator